MINGRTIKCPECGVASHYDYYYEQMVSEKTEIGWRFRQMAATHAREKADWELDRLGIVEGKKWLQRKVKKQAEVINRLEAKLRKLNQKPYAEED